LSVSPACGRPMTRRGCTGESDSEAASAESRVPSRLSRSRRTWMTPVGCFRVRRRRMRRAEMRRQAGNQSAAMASCRRLETYSPSASAGRRVASALHPAGRVAGDYASFGLTDGCDVFLRQGSTSRGLTASWLSANAWALTMHIEDEGSIFVGKASSAGVGRRRRTLIAGIGCDGSVSA